MNIKQYRIKKILSIDEGRKYSVYRCPSGKKTIGVGHNLEDNLLSGNEIYQIAGEIFLTNDQIIEHFEQNGIDDKGIDLLLENDIMRSNEILDNIFGTELLDTIENVRIEVLLCMVFNMGYSSFLGFKNMIMQILKGNMKAAAEEIKDSAYYRDEITHDRADRYYRTFKHALWVDYYYD